jgi:hypothetical protein
VKGQGKGKKKHTAGPDGIAITSHLSIILTELAVPSIIGFFY